MENKSVLAKDWVWIEKLTMKGHHEGILGSNVIFWDLSVSGAS